MNTTFNSYDNDTNGKTFSNVKRNVTPHSTFGQKVVDGLINTGLLITAIALAMFIISKLG